MATKDKKQPIEHTESGFAELARRFQAHPVLFTGTVVILLLTIVAFVFVPAIAPTDGGGSGKLTFGTYDGIPIDFIPGNYFASQRDYYNQQLRSSGQDQNIQLAAFQVWRAAFESTVVRTAVLSEVKKAGLRVPESIVDQRLAEYPAFQEEGRFSAARYRAVPDSQRMDLRNSLRDEIAADSYISQMTDLRIPTGEKEFIKAMASPERSFEFVAFPLSSYPDAEVASFINSQPDLFTSLKLSRISLDTKEADAKKLLESIKAGTVTFEEAAKANSKDDAAEKGGLLGRKFAYELKTELIEDSAHASVLALEKGAYSAVYKTSLGWSFYRCEEAAITPTADDEATMASAREYIRNFERGRMEDWLIARAETFVATSRANGFSAAASGERLPVKNFGPVSLNYGDAEFFRSISSFNLPELAGASTNEPFLSAAFTTLPSEVSKPVMLGDNAIVLRVVEERVADESSGAIIDIYYPYLVGQFAERRLRDHFLNSEKLEDTFYETFVKYFLPQ